MSYANVRTRRPCTTVDVKQHTHPAGSLTMAGLRELLQHLGAGPSGNTHVIISDVREVRVG